ncbi:hypothetical protein K6119_01915 [Paracrocinitomix mangrovi]|uniref:hypothetical protein n=1 Tax=Paracrocinitomix mangrovi TaxID=2862509 RepID=UPI001C8EBB34|nr:hypothetical protein [Paracrocinitomix mangrovi]UKN02274.1 hypothetical protein K6119_01915 [Paracrocinitomix mangrovi]
MKQIGVLISFLVVLSAQAQVYSYSNLYRVLKEQDSIFFERCFNECDLEYLNNHITEDLKFFHDQSGYQNKEVFLDNTLKYICSDFEKKPIRLLDENSLAVSPLFNNGKLYAAIQTGIHHFFLRQENKDDVWTSSAKFTHVWVIDDEKWKLSVVLSYNHNNELNESQNLEKDPFEEYIFSTYDYAYLSGKKLVVQNSVPKGGLKYTTDNTNKFYAVFWSRIINETNHSFQLRMNFSADSSVLYTSPYTYFNLYLPSAKMKEVSLDEFNYGLDLKSFLDENINKPTELNRKVHSNESFSFYVVAVFNRGVQGTLRSEITLQDQSIYYTVNEKKMQIGSIKQIIK